jgi:tetratricopeptide (TPR) repeat protein
MLVTLLGERGGWHIERLAEAFGRHGHTVEVVSWQAIGAAVGPAGLRFAPDALATADVVAVRGMPGIGSGSQRLEEVIFRMDALAQLEAAGTPVVNTPRALEIAIDKYLSLALLARAGIRVPETTIVQGEASARRAWELSKLHLGASHPQTMADAASLAAILDSLERYKESEPIYRKALKVFEKLYGPENYELAVNLNNLAAVKSAQGKAEEAEELYRKSLKMSENLLGKKHPDVALTLYNLASLLQVSGRKRDAIRLYERSLKIFEKVLKPKHPKILLVKKALKTAQA